MTTTDHTEMAHYEPAANTDRELYREPDKGNGSYYSDSIHVTEGGGIGINCGGYVIVRPLKEWHTVMRQSMNASPDAFAQAIERAPQFEMKCLSCGEALSPTCPRCQRLWES